MDYALFDWVGKDRNGDIARGQTRAQDANQVKLLLHLQGIAPSKIQEKSRARIGAIKGKEIADFTRQLATLFKAGIPVIQAFGIAAQGHPNPHLREVLEYIRSDVEAGLPLSAAFGKYPKCFGELYCNIIYAGEVAGILDDLLDRLAAHLEKTQALQSKMRSALLYPLSILIVALGVLAVMMVWVVPSFKAVFLAYGSDLPAATLGVIAVSDFFIRHGLSTLAICCLATYAGVWFWRTHENFHTAVDGLLLRLPMVGSLLQAALTARWTRTLSTMLQAGVPMVESLDCVGGACGNSVYALRTVKIKENVTSGMNVSEAMAQSLLFSPMVIQMCAVGEESGSLDHMLSKVADYFETQVDHRIAGLSSLIEPLVIVVLGVLIGSVVIAMYLPIFSMGHLI
jgi:type IV pilus assembly protein PilC